MMFSMNITLIILITLTVVYRTNKKRKLLSPMTGMIISMSNSMMASIAFGIILGIHAKDMDLTFPTIVSVSIGMLVGYITGKPVSLVASLDGVTAGIMGGMMGAMLGVMIMPESRQMMMLFLDVIYIFVMMLLLRVMDQEKKTNDNSKKTFIS